MDDCIFCKILKGEIPSYKIYEDDKTYAFLDISRDCYGHTLVIPKKHFVNVMDCEEEYMSAVAAAVRKIANHFVGECGFSGVNVLNASGKSAQQSVFHLHFHVIPRKEDDGLNMWPLSGEREIDLAEVCKKLHIN